MSEVKEGRREEEKEGKGIWMRSPADEEATKRSQFVSRSRTPGYSMPSWELTGLPCLARNSSETGYVTTK